MQEGSIVVMVEKLGDSERLALLTNGVTKWPEPSDTPLEIVELAASNELVSGVGVGLDLYPEMISRGILMDISLFREVLPPNEVSVEELIESEELVPC